ncbi:MAG: ribonuclease HII [Nitrospirota bacterium]|nr:ribonuclease HII [Nitrospirota bacterium]
MRPGPLWEYEGRAQGRGARAIAGIDEAGRGPLAGPVVAAAVILDAADPIAGLNDSKQLSEKTRERLFTEIHTRARAVGVGIVHAGEIDRINILQATILAMTQAVERLSAGGVEADYLLLDALTLSALPLPQEGIIGGDGKSASIAAASIVAKVTRDRIMVAYNDNFPGYGFAVHKGYPTRAHREALSRLGPCPIHRRSFRGVA